MQRLGWAFAARINEKKIWKIGISRILNQRRLSRVCQKKNGKENLHVLEGSCRLLKCNLAMQVFPTHDCMRGHSCLVEASKSIKLIQYAAGGTSPVKRRKYRPWKQTQHSETVQHADAASYLLHIWMIIYRIIEQRSLRQACTCQSRLCSHIQRSRFPLCRGLN